MKVLFTSIGGDTRQTLEKLGVLAELSDYKGPGYPFYEMEIESLNELFNLPEILGYDLIILDKRNYDNHIVIEIYDDYRE